MEHRNVTLICMRGLPGSGKTTWALSQLNEHTVRVNRDDLRKSMFGKYFGLTYQQENLITKIQRAAAREALRAGKSVIVDDMNLRPKYLREWNDVALEAGAEFNICMGETDVETCIEQDSARERSVGADVIRGLAQKYLVNGAFLPYEIRQPHESRIRKPVYDPKLPDTVIVDIDGTMALMGDRSPYDWERVGEDKPNFAVVNLVNRLVRDGVRITFMSGRNSVCRPQTLEWLNKHVVKGDEPFLLYMRAEHDVRQDSVMKKELFEQNILGKYNVKFVIDDRNSVVAMWRSLGLVTFQVAEGAF